MVTVKQKSEGPVLVLAGSLRERSVSLAAGHYITSQIKTLGAPACLISVEELGFPPFNPDLHRHDGSVCSAFLDMVRAAPAMVWIAPAYNGIVSGSFKNILDYLDLLHYEEPMFLAGKGIGLASTSAGLMAAVNTITSLDIVARAMRAYVIPFSVQITDAERLTQTGDEITDEKVLASLRLLAKEMATFVRMRRALLAQEVRSF